MSARSLVIFYSHSGNTRKIAQMIAEKVGADLQEIHPEVDYPIDEAALFRQAKLEMEEKACPLIRPVTMDLAQYRTIYLGTPNWFSTIAPPVATFLRQVMPNEKYIVPFCTHGGGGSGRIAKNVAEYCIGCDVLPALAIYDNEIGEAEEKIERWLK